MSSDIQPQPQKRTTRAPKIIINADDFDHIEALAEGMMPRQPELADRLLDELSRARVVKAGKMPRNVVGLGNRVTYRDETTGAETTVSLVYPEQADIERQRISLSTPIGVALIGLSEGARFHWDTRDGERRSLTVTSVGSEEAPGA